MDMRRNMTRRTALGGALATGLCLGAGNLLGGELSSRDGERPRVRPLPSDGKTLIPLLGLGCAERFPLKRRAGDATANLVYAEQMVDYALRHGVNWLDTGYAYHKGESEPFLGRVLKKYPRDSFMLSTKLPTWLVKTLDDAVRR